MSTALLRTIALILAESRYRRACRALSRANAEHTLAKGQLLRRYRADAHAVRLATPIISTTAAHFWPSNEAATKGGHRTQ